MNINIPDLVKHHHQTKYVIIHQYDDKDNEPKGFYTGPGSGGYSHVNIYSGGPDEQDKNKYEFDSDHDHYHHFHSSFDDDDKNGGNGHSYSHGFSSGYTHSTKDGDSAAPKKAAKVAKPPKKYSAPKDDNKKKVEFSFYHNFNSPTSSFSYGSDFDTPTQSYKSFDSGYDIESTKTTGTPFKQVVPTKSAQKTYGPTSATFKSSYQPTQLPNYHQTTGQYVKKYEPTVVPYTHQSTPLSHGFGEYNARKENTEKYIYNKPDYQFPSAHFETEQYDPVKDDIAGFASELSKFADTQVAKDDPHTLENFRKEDAEDEKEHAAFISEIEEDHEKF